MIQVLAILEESPRTFFHSVQLMDLFFESYKQPLQPDDLHLIGVTCIRIALKYQDLAVLPI